MDHVSEEMGNDPMAGSKVDTDAVLFDAETTTEPVTEPAKTTTESVSLDIITHNGQFHADEVCAVAILELLFGVKANIERTRDPDMIKNAPVTTFVLDVGKTYEPIRRRYDHHQSDFDVRFDVAFAQLHDHHLLEGSSYSFPMSSCGLIWLHYSMPLLHSLGIEDHDTAAGTALEAYRTFFAAIDANDNGVPYVSGRNVSTNYNNPLGLSYCLGQMNGSSNGFRKAVDVAKTLIGGYLHKLINTEIQASKEYDMLCDALNQVDNEIMVLYTPSRTVNSFLKRHDPGQSVKLIVIPENETPETKWRIYTVTYREQKFQPYIKVSGNKKDLDEGEFDVHKNHFIGFANSFDVAMIMAYRSIDEYYSWWNLKSRFCRFLFT